MKFKVLLAIIILFLVVDSGFAQRRRSGRWKQQRYELVFGLGATNFLGELGGADQIGTNFARDLEISMTRPCGSVGLRYKILEDVSAKVDLTYGRLKGEDSSTKEVFRNNRNLSFRSPLYELAFRGEYSFIQERVGHRYTLRKVRGIRGFKQNIYLFAGIAGIYFNPRAQFNGKWYSLAPLCTEGQGLVPTRKRYSRFSVALPIGLGIKYALDRKWSIGAEAGLRKTFTDYIDDVSTTYYDKELLRQAKGDVAAELSNPSTGPVSWTAAGQQRGDPFDKDSYMFLKITLTYKMRTTRTGMPKF